jgi:hypothetical protein
VVCDKHAIGGDSEYCGGNDAQLGRINVFYHEASSLAGSAPCARCRSASFTPG